MLAMEVEHLQYSLTWQSPFSFICYFHGYYQSFNTMSLLFSYSHHNYCHHYLSQEIVKARDSLTQYLNGICLQQWIVLSHSTLYHCHLLVVQWYKHCFSLGVDEDEPQNLGHRFLCTFNIICCLSGIFRHCNYHVFFHCAAI